MTMRSILVAVAVTNAVVIVIGLVVRSTRAQGRSAGRVELAVIPTSGFDPSIEEIIRYAGHLVRIRRLRDVVAGRRGRTVRLSLRSVGEGQLVQTIDVAESAVAMVRRHPLDGVEMVTLDELDRRIIGVVGADSSRPDPTGVGPPDGSDDGSAKPQRDSPLASGPPTDPLDAAATSAARNGERHLRPVGVAELPASDVDDTPVVWPSLRREEGQPDE